MTAFPLTGAGESAVVPAAQVIDLVGWQQVSDPVDHGSSCCAAARRWLGAVHAAGGPTAPLSGLGWISELYPWGPTQWPISWCEIVGQEKLDCGAHSAVAREVVRRSGVELLGVQLLLWAGAGDIAHWASTWRSQGVAPTWLFDEMYYHEAVGVAGETLVVLDTTRNCRVPPDEGPGRGNAAAIRVTGGDADTLRWGEHEVRVGHWTLLTGVR
ncbi:MAG TPA: hypothetical protein VMZ73_03405 [Acidimicrobiales bacterium]|nr:hypothetical protein [Acidimicrobiales bacterium]